MEFETQEQTNFHLQKNKAIEFTGNKDSEVYRSVLPKGHRYGEMPKGRQVERCTQTVLTLKCLKKPLFVSAET